MRYKTPAEKVPKINRARPGACWSGVGGVRGGGPASAGWSPVAGRAAQVQIGRAHV